MCILIRIFDFKINFFYTYSIFYFVSFFSIKFRLDSRCCNHVDGSSIENVLFFDSEVKTERQVWPRQVYMEIAPGVYGNRRDSGNRCCDDVHGVVPRKLEYS